LFLRGNFKGGERTTRRREGSRLGVSREKGKKQGLNTKKWAGNGHLTGGGGAIERGKKTERNLVTKGGPVTSTLTEKKRESIALNRRTLRGYDKGARDRQK